MRHRWGPSRRAKLGAELPRAHATHCRGPSCRPASRRHPAQGNRAAAGEPCRREKPRVAWWSGPLYAAGRAIPWTRLVPPSRRPRPHRHRGAVTPREAEDRAVVQPAAHRRPRHPADPPRGAIPPTEAAPPRGALTPREAEDRAVVRPAAHRQPRCPVDRPRAAGRRPPAPLRDRRTRPPLRVDL
ncbi:unnamed protein product [Urochloa humidicola]